MEENKMYFEAVFTFSEEVPESVKEKAIMWYNWMRTMVVDETNPKFEEWNNAYTDEVTGEDDMKYNAYIASLENEICDRHNKIFSKISPVRIFADQYADLAGQFKYGGRLITMHLSLKPFKN